MLSAFRGGSVSNTPNSLIMLQDPVYLYEEIVGPTLQAGMAPPSDMLLGLQSHCTLT